MELEKKNIMPRTLASLKKEYLSINLNFLKNCDDHNHLSYLAWYGCHSQNKKSRKSIKKYIYIVTTDLTEYYTTIIMKY